MTWSEGRTREFRCTCHTHYLVVENLDRETVWLGFYTRYRNTGLLKRLADAWALLRGREVLVDDFVFGRDTAVAVGNAMEEAARPKLPGG